MSQRRAKIERTSAGLRDALFDTMENLLNGEIEANEAKAMAVVAREIVNTVRLEVDVQKLRAEYPADTKILVPSPLPLGRQSAIESHAKDD